MERLTTIDLGYLGLDEAAAAFLLDGGSEGPILVECGTMATLPRLEAGLRSAGVDPAEIAHVLVTHIHLDHAGAAGAFARRGATVHVHPFGAPHLIDPARLVSSSRRVHGAAFDHAYGDPIPCQAERVRAVKDGDSTVLGPLRFTALETPGHARHHHAWLLEEGGGTVCFAGDVAAMRVPGSAFLSVPMPPPEFDLDAWRRSIDRLSAASIDALHLTHFGVVDDPAAHLDALRVRLEEEVELVRRLVEGRGTRTERLAEYRAWLWSRAGAAGVDDARRQVFLGEGLMGMNLDGVDRWRQRLEASTT